MDVLYAEKIRRAHHGTGVLRLVDVLQYHGDMPGAQRGEAIEERPLVVAEETSEEIVQFVVGHQWRSCKKRKSPARGGGLSRSVGGPYFTFVARSAPALNLTTFLAAILISLPVWGLRPLRAARLVMLKVPKPTSATRSPFFRALVVLVTKASTARFASALESFASAAIDSINSALFNPMMFGVFEFVV